MPHMNASLDTRHLLDTPLASLRALPFGTHLEHLEIMHAMAETDVDPRLLLDTPPEDLWIATLHANGIDPTSIVPGGTDVS